MLRIDFSKFVPSRNYLGFISLSGSSSFCASVVRDLKMLRAKGWLPLEMCPLELCQKQAWVGDSCFLQIRGNPTTRTEVSYEIQFLNVRCGCWSALISLAQSCLHYKKSVLADLVLAIMSVYLPAGFVSMMFCGLI